MLLFIVVYCLRNFFRVSFKEVSEPDYYYTESETVTDKVRGDVNADGEFNVSDLVLMQKWLLAVPDTVLADWQAGDLNADEKLDIGDMILMREMLAEH